ncbi:BamA/OMP85 family outer membrane protein [Marinilabilia rubra]|uniref:BamA/OMP85 family outer membrane protein n=1 Tax=Marinilabilia rubra TaxID=2162893 RepID=UPI001E622349|nr:BamA/TamA family outer membrane protein [Marinilabilia rubra]
MEKIIYKIFLVVLLFLALQEGQAQENAEIRKIKFKGNDAFNDGELLDKITFREATWVGKTFFKKEPSFYSVEAWEMNKAQLKAFYQSEGYLHVKIHDPEIDEPTGKYKVELKIRIEENKPVVVDSVSFETYSEGATDSLFDDGGWRRHLKRMEVEQGMRFQDDLVNSDQDAISEWFSSQGYAYVKVEPKVALSKDTSSAVINWQISKGPFCRLGELTIEGVRRTPEEAIQKQLAVTPGDPYSSGKLSRSQKQVYELGLFRIASLQAGLSNQQPDTIPLTLTIEEAPRWSTRFGVGYGREDQFRTFVDIDYLNFPGKTMRSNFYAKHSGLEPYRFEATITQPAVFGPSSSLEFNPEVGRRSEEGFESFRWGGDLSLHQNLSDEITASVSLYFERVNIDIESDFERSLSELNQSTYSKNGISLGMLFNTAKPRFDPANGWSLAFNTRANSSLFNSPYPFLKYLFEAKRYQPLTNGVVLAMRFEGGSILPVGKGVVTPFEERYFAGGSQSVRGWARQMLGPMDEDGVPIGGNSIIEGSIEPRVKVIGPVSLVGFLDYGNVWRSQNMFKVNDMRFAAGAGIRVSTPIGPVGLDFARPVFESLKKWQIHLNIGHAF